jgi:hypothetical protein
MTHAQGKVIAASLPTSTTRSFIMRSFSCPKANCHQPFNNVTELLHHMQMSSDHPDFTYETCGRFFRRAIHLEHHLHGFSECMSSQQAPSGDANVPGRVGCRDVGYDASNLVCGSICDVMSPAATTLESSGNAATDQLSPRARDVAAAAASYSSSGSQDVGGVVRTSYRSA